MVVIERVAPAGRPPFLRVTLPAGECSWGNANIPLPAANLKGQDGLALRIRAKPSTETVVLSLHAMSLERQSFYQADCEVGEEWSDLILPWAEFRLADQHAFQPSQAASVNLQIQRPSRSISQEIVIEIDQIDFFSATLCPKTTL